MIEPPPTGRSGDASAEREAENFPAGATGPPGARVARYYCPKGHVTFSLLPDSLASGLPSTLPEVERVVREVEQSDEGLER